MRRAIRVIATVSAASAGVCVLAGCAGDDGTQAYREWQEIRGDATPELATLYQREADVDNALTVMENENKRMFLQDLGRVFYTDRPSRLTREPIPW